MEQERIKIALIHCPAWGPIPPLGSASLKSFMISHGYIAKCFDFNIEFYNSSSNSVKKSLWGADCYNNWSLDYSCQTDVKFNQGSIININSLPLKQWADEILFFKPDILGFSVNLTNMTVSLLLAAELKKLIPGIFIVFGGPNAAQDREGNIILHTRIPDIVVHGEGEETLLEITKILENHGDFSAISSIGFLKNN